MTLNLFITIVKRRIERLSWEDKVRDIKVTLMRYYGRDKREDDSSVYQNQEKKGLCAVMQIVWQQSLF